MVRENLTIVIRGVDCMAEILKVMVLLVELGGIDVYLLDHASQVIVLSDYLIGGLEFSELSIYLFLFEFTHIYLWS